MFEMELPLQQIYITRKEISPYCLRTPLVRSPKLSEGLRSIVYLKLENLQEIGSFKVRGAANKILGLTPEQKIKGVITASTGNHGMAVSYVAKRVGIPAIICVSEAVPKNRIETIQRLGARAVVFGASQDDAFTKMKELQEQYGYISVHPFDDLEVIAGQATIGLELIEDLPTLEMVLVPLSGGGLISGIAHFLKTVNPSVKVIGISMEQSPVMYHSLKAGVPIQMEEKDTIADSLRGGIGLNNQYTFRFVNQLVDDVILVSEEEIAQGMAYLFSEHRLIVEGAGAVGVAALLSHKVKPFGNTITIVSGRSIETSRFLDAISPYQSFDLD